MPILPGTITDHRGTTRNRNFEELWVSLEEYTIIFLKLRLSVVPIRLIIVLVGMRMVPDVFDDCSCRLDYVPREVGCCS